MLRPKISIPSARQLLRFAKQRLPRLCRDVQQSISYRWELVKGGGRIRERMLLALLGQYFASKEYREWYLSKDSPHFYNQRFGIFEMGFGACRSGPFPFYRGMFASEVLRDGDCLLDIGCGDGFFTRRFFGLRCKHIDGIDVEPDAIAAARACNAAPNITYHLQDAVTRPFPLGQYDVVVWDGAIGHFSRAYTAHMLEKIVEVLPADGIFVGSESLGKEGHDHLQFLESLDELHSCFRPYFPHIALRRVTYPLSCGIVRTEAYWRCSKGPTRLQECTWHYSPATRHES